MNGSPDGSLPDLAATTQTIRLEAERQAIDDVLGGEILAVERKTQTQSCFLIGATVVVMTLIADAVLPEQNAEHWRVIRLIGAGLGVFFFSLGAVMKYGRYRPALKYLNVLVQVTMVTMVIAVDARMLGARYALASMPPLFYALVVGVSSLSLSPRLCLVAGVSAAIQFLAIYHFMLRPLARSTESLADPIAGWPITAMKSVVLVSVGVAAMFMARRARSLLERVAAQLVAEEKLKSIENELGIARRIQERLIPTESPTAEGLEFSSYYLPSKDVGGDYWDVVPRGDGSVLIVVADVAGKGVPAAMTMANFQAIVRTLARYCDDTAGLAASVNDLVCSTATDGRFVTACFVLIDASRRWFSATNCGHNPLILRTDDGNMRRLDAGGPPLGVIEGVTFSSDREVLRPGAIMVLYTDGISELRSSKTRELFGIERLETIVADPRVRIAAETRTSILTRVAEFLGNGTPNDDLTCVVVRVD